MAVNLQYIETGTLLYFPRLFLLWRIVFFSIIQSYLIPSKTQIGNSIFSEIDRSGFVKINIFI